MCRDRFKAALDSYYAVLILALYFLYLKLASGALVGNACARVLPAPARPFLCLYATLSP